MGAQLTSSTAVEQSDNPLPAWLLERHKDRYRKVFRREMSLSRALEENDADWRRAYDELREALT